jgi:DNA-binding beta-propeller fold protein YncE
MKYTCLALAIVLLACSDDESKHRKLTYTFVDDNGLQAIASTDIEPDGKTNYAIHTFVDPIAVVVNPKTHDLYFSTGGDILVYKTNDLTNIKTLYDPETGTGVLAIDPQHNKIYWAQNMMGIVQSANLDGTSKSFTSLFDGSKLSFNYKGIAVDPTKSKIYLLDADAKRILVGDLTSNNTPVELVNSNTFAMGNPRHLVISQDGSTLYWTDTNKIVQTDTQTGATTIFRDSHADQIFIHYPTNHLYITGSRNVFKTEIGGATTLQRVYQEEQSAIGPFAVE